MLPEYIKSAAICICKRPRFWLLVKLNRYYSGSVLCTSIIDCTKSPSPTS